MNRIATIFAVYILHATSGASDTVLVEETRPGNPLFYEEYLYRVYYDPDTNAARIEHRSGEVVTRLKEYKQYAKNGKTKLKIVSKLGFSFDNIPMDNCYFYNEAIAIFLMAEDYLPKAQAWLKKNGYIIVALSEIHLFFPDNPIIHEEYHYTQFWWEADWYWNTKEQQWTWYGNKWVLGYADEHNKDAYVTYGYKDPRRRCVVVHEYFHLCGYDHKDGPFKKGGDLFSTYE